MKKNRIIFCSLLFLGGIFFVRSVYAGTLSCTVRSAACSGGEVEIYEMESTSNSHAGLSAASYDNLVCCTGVSGIGNTCSGTFGTVLKLSGTTNAHVRQGTLSDYASVTNACISVPSGSEIIVGYQATDCTGFDTMLGSMIGTTNSHVGNGAWTEGTTKICATGSGGALTVDILDVDDLSVVDPSMVMDSATFSLVFQTVLGTLGTASEKIRVDNTSINPQWSLDIAATGGPTAFWDAATADYDFNDASASATDGADPDSLGGQMSIDPTSATITPVEICDNTGLSLGDAYSFLETAPVVSSIQLLSAGGTAGTTCFWDLTGIGISQTIPLEQPSAADYDIDMTITITAT